MPLCPGLRATRHALHLPTKTLRKCGRSSLTNLAIGRRQVSSREINHALARDRAFRSLGLLLINCALSLAICVAGLTLAEFESSNTVSTFTLLPFALFPYGRARHASTVKKSEEVLIAEHDRVVGSNATDFFESTARPSHSVILPAPRISRDFAEILRWNVKFASTRSLKSRVRDALERFKKAEELSHTASVNKLSATALLHALVRRALITPQDQSRHEDAVGVLIKMSTAQDSGIPWKYIRRRTLHHLARSMQGHIFDGDGRPLIAPDQWQVEDMPVLLYDKATQRARSEGSRQRLALLYCSYRQLVLQRHLQSQSGPRRSIRSADLRIKGTLRAAFDNYTLQYLIQTPDRLLNAIDLRDREDLTLAVDTLHTFARQHAGTPSTSPFLISTLAGLPLGRLQRSTLLELYTPGNIRHLLSSARHTHYMSNALLYYAFNNLRSSQAASIVMATMRELGVSSDRVTFCVALQGGILLKHHALCHSTLAVIGLAMDPPPITSGKIESVAMPDSGHIDVDSRLLELYLRALLRFGEFQRASFLIKRLVERLMPLSTRIMAHYKSIFRRKVNLTPGLLTLLLHYAVKVGNFYLADRIWSSATANPYVSLRRLAKMKDSHKIRLRLTKGRQGSIAKSKLPLAAYWIIARACQHHYRQGLRLALNGMPNNNSAEAILLAAKALAHLPLNPPTNEHKLLVIELTRLLEDMKNA